MKVTYKFYKNSNTGELRKTQTFSETNITGIPVYHYDIEGNSIEQSDLKGFVEISERKFLRESKKHIIKPKN